MKRNNVYEIRNKISKILSSLLIPATLKVFGYTLFTAIPLLFVSFINFPKVFFSSKITKENFPSFILFSYLIIQSIRGLLILNDLRVLVWTMFFIFLVKISELFSKYIFYFESKKFLSNEIIKYSIFSFLIYTIISLLSLIIYNDIWQIQDLWLTGSSAAFTTAIPFFSGQFLESVENNKIKRRNLLFIMFYAFVCGLCQSRLGFLILFTYLIFLGLSKINLKKLEIKKSFFNVLIIFLLSMTAFESYYFLNNNQSYLLGLYQQNIERESDVSQNNDIDRISGYISTYNKITNNIPDFIFGTGWYTSRVLQIPYFIETREEYGLQNNLEENQTLFVDSFVSLFSDLGTLGFLIMANVYRQTFIRIKNCSNGFWTKAFFTTLLIIHFLSIFIGFQYASITYWLTFLPQGLLVCQLTFYEKIKN